MNTFEKLKPIIKRLFIFRGELTMESKLVEDLGADSLDIVNLICDIEREFAINVPEEVLTDIRTIDDIVSYIEENVEKVG